MCGAAGWGRTLMVAWLKVDRQGLQELVTARLEVDRQGLQQPVTDRPP